MRDQLIAAFDRPGGLLVGCRHGWSFSQGSA
jgi:hypothetical protein